MEKWRKPINEHDQIINLFIQFFHFINFVWKAKASLVPL